MHRLAIAALVIAACAPRTLDTGAYPPVATAPRAVKWAEVRAEIDRLVCIASFHDAEIGAYELPLFGARELCGMTAASTPLERAVERAFADARDVHIAFPDEEAAAQEAVRSESTTRADAVRAAYFTDRFLAPLQRRLAPLLRAEGLTCADCPPAAVAVTRTVTWDELSPYLAAYVWPDPVVTPAGPNGEPGGAPRYSMHICVGLNGLSRLPAIDEQLRFAALLAAFHTEALHDRATAALREVLRDPGFIALGNDDARTLYLRERVGPTVAADPNVRAAICATLARFANDVTVRVDGCAP